MHPSPIKAVSVAVFHNGKFLLVRRGRPPAFGLYAFPGGKVEADESLDEAVRREAMEETSAELTDIRHIVDLEIPCENDNSIIQFVLSVHGARFVGGTINAGDDAAEVDWFSIDEMRKLPLAASVLEIAQQIAAEFVMETANSIAGNT